jgi:hypothetical protein
MQLKPGLRLESATSDTQIVVVKAPADVDVDLRCGGHPMAEIGSSPERRDPAAEGGPTQMGKRYESADLGLEVLCTKGGDGALSIGDAPLALKSAKPLPSSD